MQFEHEGWGIMICLGSRQIIFDVHGGNALAYEIVHSFVLRIVVLLLQRLWSPRQHAKGLSSP